MLAISVLANTRRLTSLGIMAILAGMNFLLDILYAVALIVISPLWLYSMVRHGRYMRGVPGRFGVSPRMPKDKPVIWLHAVSLGEINGIRTLVDQLEKAFDGKCRLAISSTTDTGMNQARKLYSGRHTVFQFPLDFTLVLEIVFRRIRPSVIVLMEGEIWPNMLRIANNKKVPVIVVNGRMSSKKGYPRYMMARHFVRPMFNRVDVIALQNEIYAERFKAVGTIESKIRITGMMKYDTAEAAANITGTAELAAAIGLQESHRLIVAGGTGSGEEKMLLDMFSAMKTDGRAPDDVRLAIVPRKPERFGEVARLIEDSGFKCLRRSENTDGSISLDDMSDAVILGDTMGELRKFYCLAECIFVGRSLVALGGSDMIEAAAIGKPVAFGPHVFNFPQVEDMLAEKAAVQVADADELGDLLAKWLACPDEAAALGQVAEDFVRSRKGATGRNLELIMELFNSTRHCAGEQ